MEKLRKLYYQGQYDKVIKTYHKEKPTKGKSFLVGAYFMLGRTEEGESFLKSQRDYFENNPLEKVISNFFYGLNLMRRSEYKEAKSIFIESFFIKEKSGESRFYLYQALAFFQYYRGYFLQAKNLASRALDHCNLEQLSFEKIYALDILGHSNIQLGMFYKGIDLLSQATALANELECVGTSSAIGFSLIGYNLESGINIEKNITLATELIESDDVKEFYLKGQLQLQLSKALFLTGNLSEMERILNDASYSIYKSQNHRQILALNIGLSLLNFYQGKPSQALTHINNAKLKIDPKIDNLFKLKTLGLSKKILSNLKQDTFEIDRELTELRKKMIHFMDYTHSQDALEITDPVFRLIRNFKSSNLNDFITILDQKCLLGVLNLIKDTNQTQLRFSISSRDKQILIIHNGIVRWSSDKLTKFQYQFLKFIFSYKQLSKKELIEVFWGYEYNPIIHDSLIYNTINRIKKLDSLIASFIEIDIDVSITKDCQIYGLERKVADERPEVYVSEESLSTDETKDILNFRQLLFLKNSFSGEMITPKSYREHFEVSRITATRDLKELAELGYIIPRGKTRSIRYERVESK